MNRNASLNNQVIASLIFVVLFLFSVTFVFEVLQVEDMGSAFMWSSCFFIAFFIAFFIYVEVYFRGDKFKAIKESIRDHTNNCNELNHYIEELKGPFVNIESYNYGRATMTDASAFNFQRREWRKDSNSNQVIDCSLSVCRNARNQPIKYLVKYFDIEKDEETLSKFEKILNDFTSVEEGKQAIENERNEVLNQISNKVSWLIKTFAMTRYISELGFEKVDISNAYMPTYTFQYVSAGGNSSARCDIKLDIENLNYLVSFLNEAIKWRKSVAGQRALMTSRLRTEIKERDHYDCQSCGLGTKDEPNLLLEIDHIMPVSKGGLTSKDNLQTLCWRCNRSKGSKIPFD